MTPFASQMYRHGDDEIRARLAQCQFFECTAIFPLAREMHAAEIARLSEPGSHGVAPFSEFSQLPAPRTVLELNTGSGRQVLLCEERGREIVVSGFIPGPSGDPVPRWRSSFTPGEADIRDTQWFVYAGEAPFLNAELGPEHRQMQIVRAGVGLVETLLCLINQPGLIDPRERPTDKRVLRESLKSGEAVSSTWHECRVQLGAHAGSSSATLSPEEPVRPLHYVRKYYKPTVGKWVEGYWRGDISLGLHLKWYSPRPPSSGIGGAL